MKIREMLTENLGLKALSLFLAAVIWLFVSFGREAEIELALPVVLANVPQGLVVANSPPARIDVRLAGPRILLLRLGARPRPVLLDLKGAGEGVTAFPEMAKNLPLPYGVRVTRVTPAAIEVRLAGNGSPGNAK
ncbi:MAG TPA: hypothetical protein VF795_04945 [Desulfuromonadaceae bacterium]